VLGRVSELGVEIARDYAKAPPLLIAPLKSSFVFLADLSRRLTIAHEIEFVELAGYGGARPGDHSGIRLLKDLDTSVAERDLIIVEDVVDTGLTLNYLT